MSFMIKEMLKIFKSRHIKEKTFCQFGILCDFCTPFSGFLNREL